MIWMVGFFTWCELKKHSMYLTPFSKFQKMKKLHSEENCNVQRWSS